MTVDKFKPLRFHKVHLFPDVGKYEGWQEKKKELLKEYPFADIEVSRECELWFEKWQIEKGDDIAEFYLRLWIKKAKWIHLFKIGEFPVLTSLMISYSLTTFNCSTLSP